MKEVVKKSRTMVKFIKRQHMPLAISCKHEEKLTLLMFEKTKFGSNFMMVDRLLQIKIDIAIKCRGSIVGELCDQTP
jgi:hypothetical protein